MNLCVFAFLSKSKKILKSKHRLRSNAQNVSGKKSSNSEKMLRYSKILHIYSPSAQLIASFKLNSSFFCQCGTALFWLTVLTPFGYLCRVLLTLHSIIEAR